MAKSKLILRRKKSTVLVSVQTLQEAIKRANQAVEMLMKSDMNDPRINKIEGASNHMSRILNANPQQMRQDGVSQIADYMDDAKMPAEARKLKQEVDMISQVASELRGPGAAAPAAPAPQGVGYVPDSAVMSSAKNADGGAAFSTDRNEQGEAKAPEKLEVPRLAKKKKKEAEDPALDAAAPVPPVPPVPPVAEAAPAPAPAAPAAGGNAIDYIPTETLIKVIGDIQKEEDFAQNRGKQDALIQLTEIIKARPVLPAEQPEAAAAPAPASTAPALAGAPAPVTASGKTADLGDHAMDAKGDTISDGSGASVSIGQGGSPSTAPSPKAFAPDAAKPKAPSPFGGLSLSSALEDEKTADDYRIQDYKLTEEGIRPSGAMPTADEQLSGHHSVDFPEQNMELEASMEKEAVTPPGISESLMHKLKDEYPGDKSKAYATAWSIHNKKESSEQIEAAFDEGARYASVQIAKHATNAAGGGWFTSYKPMEVDEDGGRTQEIGEAHSMLEDHTGISKPAVVEPIKLNDQQGLKTGAKTAADMTTGKAVKEAESIGNDLKKMYLEAKSLTGVNDTRPVREAVEAIFRAADMFDEATKTLNKQHQQEESEAEAAKIKSENKGKKSNLGGLAVAAGE